MSYLTNTSFGFLLKAAWRYVGDGRRRMILIYVMFLFANILAALQPIVLAKIINTVQGQNANAMYDVLVWAAIYAGLIIMFWLLHGPARVIERHLSFKIFDHFVTSLYTKVTEMPLRWHQDHHSGDTINRINKAGRALFNFSQEQFICIEMVVRFSMSIIVLGVYSLPVLVVSLALSGAIALVVHKFDSIITPLLNAQNEREHALNASLFDYISNIITILTLRVQDNTRAEVKARIAAIKPPHDREVTLNEWKWALVNVALVVAQAAIVGSYIAFHLWRRAPLQIGSVIAIFQYLLMISQVFYSAASVFGRMMQRNADLHGVDGLCADHAQLVHTAAAVDRIWKRIDIHNLSFTHHEGEDVLHHLSGVDFSMAPGQKIALIGSSGSGKTTLLTLLRGLYEAQSVRLSIDGQMFETLAPLSGFTTLVPQDSEIFENTVYYNLTLGTDVPETIVDEALSITTFDEVVPKLPNGIATDIRERGVNLSGGQKQRLALARGLIAARDSSLLLLDEPTSSVDLATESVIFDRLFAVFRDKTVVASVHRLHLLPRFTYICLMKDGAIIEQGTFADMLSRQGEFHSIWQHHLVQSSAGE